MKWQLKNKVLNITKAKQHHKSLISFYLSDHFSKIKKS